MKIRPPGEYLKMVSRMNGLARAGPLSFRVRRKMLILDSGQGPP